MFSAPAERSRSGSVGTCITTDICNADRRCRRPGLQQQRRERRHGRHDVGRRKPSRDRDPRRDLPAGSHVYKTNFPTRPSTTHPGASSFCSPEPLPSSRPATPTETTDRDSAARTPSTPLVAGIVTSHNDGRRHVRTDHPQLVCRRRQCEHLQRQHQHSVQQELRLQR